MLRQFLLLFAGAFCISLFVLMMQFLWRYVDELIGKGLSMEVLAQFFWYMALMLVPTALPLAVLLASLITMGNLGESSELTAIGSVAAEERQGTHCRHMRHSSHIILLPERGRTQRQHELQTTAAEHEAEKPRAGDSRGDILFGHPRL